MFRSHLVGRLRCSPRDTGAFWLDFAYFSGNTAERRERTAKRLRGAPVDGRSSLHEEMTALRVAANATQELTAEGINGRRRPS